jgi:type II secretory pathway component GspD/PulD (secretin)
VIQARQRAPVRARRSRLRNRHAAGLIPAAALAACASLSPLGAGEAPSQPPAAGEAVPAQSAPAPAPRDPGGESATGVAALLEMARAEFAAEHFVAARELYQWALTRDPANAAARAGLALAESALHGRPGQLAPPATDASLHEQVALAEARMAYEHADEMARAGRPEDAALVLAPVRANLLPFKERDEARLEIQRIDTLMQACQTQTKAAQETDRAAGRSGDREAAVARMRAALRRENDTFHERMARIEALEDRQLIEAALGECRHLVTDYPSEPAAAKLLARLIKEVHEQRRLTLDEQRTELLQEVQEQMERSMIPTGFDGVPIYPEGWDLRHSGRGELDAPVEVPPWEAMLRERLSTKVSFNFDAMSAADALNALARMGAINLVIDPTVTAAGDKTVTLKANNMGLDNALSWLCRLIDTHWLLSKGAVYIGGMEDGAPILAVYDVSDLLFVPKDFPGRTMSFNIGAGGAGGAGGGFNAFKNNPADNKAEPSITPEDLVDHIQKAVSPDTWMNPAYGITVRGSTLMVTAPERVHLLISQYIRAQSHIKNVLVRVDARWLTIDDNYLEEIGVEWNTTNPAQLLQYTNNPNLTDGFISNTASWYSNGSLTNNMPNTAVAPNPSTSGTGLSLSSTIIKQVQAAAILTAVERAYRGTTLAAPSVTTINGVRANTFMGNQFAYIASYDVGAGGGNGLSATLDPKIGILNTGAILDIKPYVSSDLKYVTMEFKPSLATLESDFVEELFVPRFFPTGFNAGGAGGAGAVIGNVIIQSFPIELPNILLEELQTNVTIPDDGSLLVGGWANNIDQTTSAEIPFLGHIPFLGRLFGQRGRYSTRQKLYMLATVHVINYQELEAKQ